MVSNQEFREDLFYRLHIFPLFLPPLRERKTDIPGLATHFVKQFSVSMNKDIRTISDRAMRSMINHSWPGNVRELQNYVARGVILARGTTFDLIPPDKRVTLRAEPTSEKLEDTIRGEILAACHKANWQIGGPRGGRGPAGTEAHHALLQDEATRNFASSKTLLNQNFRTLLRTATAPRVFRSMELRAGRSAPRKIAPLESHTVTAMPASTTPSLTS